jgi:nucleotide-binding universal stress UspA family protein
MFKRILVPTDFSACADEALAVAVDLAKKFDARLILAHACESPSTAYMGMMATPLDLVTPVREAAKDALAQSFELLKRKYQDCESALLFGNAPLELLRAIDSTGADLVVLGTHGRTGLTHLLLGSVAEKIVRTSPVPVLTVRKRK